MPPTELKKKQQDDMLYAFCIRINMALAEVCGLNSYVDFNSLQETDKLPGEIERYTRNFTNNVQLAVPPYINVSIDL